MGFLEGLYNLSLGVGLTREAQQTTLTWLNQSGPTISPDWLSSLLGWGYAFADIIVVGFLVWRFSSFALKRWPWATILLPLLFAFVWAMIFNPLAEADKASLGFAQFQAYAAANPITISGWIALLITGITMVLFFYPWKVILSFILYLGWVFIMGSILAWQVIDTLTLDWAVTLSLVLINFSFIYKLIRLPLVAIGRAARQEARQQTIFWSSIYALAYSIAFVWLSLMYPDLYLGPVHVSFLLLIAAIIFAIISMLSSGKPKTSGGVKA